MWESVGVGECGRVWETVGDWEFCGHCVVIVGVGVLLADSGSARKIGRRVRVASVL